MTKSLATTRVKRVHPEDIKAAIRKTGFSCTELSIALGYSQSAVGICLRRSWPALEAGIAGHLGVPPQSLWPDRYDGEGHPLSFPASKRSRAAAIRHRSKSNPA